jgi:hypothetical protein
MGNVLLFHKSSLGTRNEKKCGTRLSLWPIASHPSQVVARVPVLNLGRLTVISLETGLSEGDLLRMIDAMVLEDVGVIKLAGVGVPGRKGERFSLP